MSKFWTGIALALQLLAVAARLAYCESDRVEEVDRAKVCMLEDRVQARPGLPEVYNGKTYYLCCPMCKQTFENNPEKYSKARDPVSGDLVDKATAPLLAYKGQAYFFASEENRAAFARDPARYAGKR